MGVEVERNWVSEKGQRLPKIGEFGVHEKVV